MGWRDWSYWLKGGIIGGFLISIWYPIVLSLKANAVEIFLSEIFFPGVFLGVLFLGLIPSSDQIFLWYSIVEIGNFIFYFIIGAIIGLIVGKVKIKNRGVKR